MNSNEDTVYVDDTLLCVYHHTPHPIGTFCILSLSTLCVVGLLLFLFLNFSLFFLFCVKTFVFV